MTIWEALLLIGGGFLAGIINVNAGGGSLLTVPLLNLAGVPGTIANGSNRVGVLAANLSAVTTFRRLGMSGLRPAVPVLLPVLVGAGLGATVSSYLTDGAFERIFGFMMVPILLLSLRKAALVNTDTEKSWSPVVRAIVFFAVGTYGGAFQAGVGLLLLLALSRAGFDLVMANSVKVVVVLAQTLIALPIFIARGQVAWGPALVLAVGFAAGGAMGARVAVEGGERVIRPILVVAVFVLAGRMLGLY